MAEKTFSRAIAADAGVYDPPVDYLTISAELLGAIYRHSTHSFGMCSWLFDDDPETIYFGHSPTRFPGFPNSPVPGTEGRLCLIQGNDVGSAQGVVLHHSALRAAGNVDVLDTMARHGAALSAASHGYVGPHNHGDANTVRVSHRPLFMVPNIWHERILQLPTNCMSVQDFYDRILAPTMQTPALAAQLAPFQPLVRLCHHCSR